MNGGGRLDKRTDGRTTTFRDELSLHAVRKNEAEIKFAHDRSSPRNQEHEIKSMKWTKI